MEEREAPDLMTDTGALDDGPKNDPVPARQPADPGDEALEAFLAAPAAASEQEKP